ncbi:hypothetical protein AGMMS49938_04360 [Fibrobacterales bacterium]|nr:hypothetical protein AGMMS49938_04360 [Fibrobacterales bacterium]
MNKESSREYWIDYVKLFACLLVAFGHLLRSFNDAGITDRANPISHTIEVVIYLFHVPLFFFCSGYLYQKLSKINSLRAYGNNTLKKFINLGVPYFTFFTITYLLKTWFSGSVNTPVQYGYWESLLFHPINQFWFFHALFLAFLVTPTVASKKGISILLALSIGLLTLRNISGTDFAGGGGGY